MEANKVVNHFGFIWEGDCSSALRIRSVRYPNSLGDAVSAVALGASRLCGGGVAPGAWIQPLMRFMEGNFLSIVRPEPYICGHGVYLRNFYANSICAMCANRLCMPAK